MTSQFNAKEFLTRFFESNECEVTVLENGVIEVKLTEKIDRAIMNRPFYWHYVKATGQAGVPERLTFCTNHKQKAANSEWIDFGTPRMNDISRHLEQSSRFIQVFEQLDVLSQTALHPWLIINATITFKGKQVKEHLLSIGLNLITGLNIKNAMEELQGKNLAQSINPNCYTITPLIKVQSGFQRIEQFIERYFKQQNYSWVLDSLLLLKEELLLLKHFYENNEQQDNLIKEVIQLYARLRPEVKYEVINGGIFYLEENFMR